jgi:hypothetical protein
MHINKAGLKHIPILCMFSVLKPFMINNTFVQLGSPGGLDKEKKVSLQ